MSYIRYNHTHTRERSHSRERSPLFTTRPVVRRDSKRVRFDLDGNDDDEYDDYPYAAAPAKPSRALTIREPTQIEDLNIWSSPNHTRIRHRHRHRHPHFDDDDHSDDQDSFSYDHYRHIRQHNLYHSRSNNDHDDYAFRLKIKTAAHHPPAMNWPGTLFHSRSHEHSSREDFVARERHRSTADNGFRCIEEPRLERKITYRRVRKTRTEEYRPLGGFGRF